MFAKWEKGAFVQNVANPAYSMKGEVTTFYEDGNVTIENPKTGFKWQSGKPTGKVQLKVTEGPMLQGPSTAYLEINLYTQSD